MSGAFIASIRRSLSVPYHVWLQPARRHRRAVFPLNSQGCSKSGRLEEPADTTAVLPLVREQEGAMNLPKGRRLQQVPKYFPVGSAYVVEGRGGYCGRFRVSARQLIMPDGWWIDLPINPDLEPDLEHPDLGTSRLGTLAPGHCVGKVLARSKWGTAQTVISSQQKNLHRWTERDARSAVNCSAPGEAPQPLTLNHPALNPGRISGRGSS